MADRLMELSAPEPHPHAQYQPWLTNTTAIDAGGNSGIGYEASRKLARAGATVVLGVRSLEAGEE